MYSQTTHSDTYVLNAAVAMQHGGGLVAKVTEVMVLQGVVVDHEVGETGQEQQVQQQQRAVEPASVRFPANQNRQIKTSVLE
jgi:hypothetical protein